MEKIRLKFLQKIFSQPKEAIDTIKAEFEGVNSITLIDLLGPDFWVKVIVKSLFRQRNLQTIPD